MATDLDRIERERVFHDQWASRTELPDARHSNEALTSPELRFIHSRLGDLKGKEVMDLGCGLGEVSIYFALQGALVTSVDLSGEMLNATQRLAALNGVEVATHRAAAEDLGLGENRRFDVIYVGNLFHHVDIQKTLSLILPHLKPEGLLVSWDPLAYNPIINLYRRIATQVRTVDEHPLTKSDLDLIASKFSDFEMKMFWFSTLIIFIAMALVQGRNPNEVRYWKAVVDESDRWAWLYRPLERLDGFLLKVVPPLKWLCWNVVIIGRHPLIGNK